MLDKFATLRTTGKPHGHLFATFALDVVLDYRISNQAAAGAWTGLVGIVIEDRRRGCRSCSAAMAQDWRIPDGV